MKQKLKMSLLALCVIGCLVSCMDNSYDLSNIDKTIGSEVNLTMPNSSTGDIMLKNFIHLKDNGVIKIIPNPNSPGDSMYIVSQTGKADIKPVIIGAIHVSQPTVQNITAKVALRDGSNTRHRSISVDVYGTNVTIPNKAYRYDLKDGDASQPINNASATGISADVVSITKVSCEEVIATLKLRISGYESYITKMHFDNLRLLIPSDLTVESCNFDGTPGTIDQANGILTFTGDNDKERVVNKDLIMTLKIKGLTEGKQFIFDSSNHSAALNGNFEVRGTFRLLSDDMDPTLLGKAIDDATKDWTESQIQAWKNDPDLSKISGILPSSLEFKAVTTFNKELIINKVSGSFQHEVGKIAPIKLNDLPDFLNDPEVVMDLDNPMIFVNTSSAIPSKGKSEIVLTSQNKTDKSVVVRRASMEFEGTKTFWMANNFEDETYMLEEQKKKNLVPTVLYTDAAHTQKGDVTGLIKKIPDQIEVYLSTVQMEAEDLDITQTYDIKADYEVYSPLTFGPEFKLVYQDNETKMNIGTDIDKLNVNDSCYLTVTAEATSTLPTACNLTVKPLDANKKEIDVLKDVSTNIEAYAKEQPITLYLKPKEGHTLNEILHSGATQMDGIHYKAILDNAEQGKVLDTKGYIILKNIKVSISGIVSYDGN